MLHPLWFARSMARMEPQSRERTKPDGLPATALLERTLLEMSRHPLIELADSLASEGEVRFREEGDAGPFLESLAEFLQGKEAAIIGGVAVRAFVRGRPTMDLDVMIDERHWSEMASFLAKQGARSTGCIEDTLLYDFAEFRLDLEVRVAKSDLDRAALRTLLSRRSKQWMLHIVQPDYLAAMKVKAYGDRKGTAKGDQDRRDVQRLVAGPTHASAVRVILQTHRQDLLATLEEILSEPPRT